MLKCALVLLAAALFLCSFHTCATSTDIREVNLPKLNMRSNTLIGALTAADESFTVAVTVTSTDAGGVTVTITITVTGAGAGSGAVVFTGISTGSLTSAGFTDTPVEVTISGSGNTGKTVTGSIHVSGTITGAITVKGTGTGTFTSANAKPVSLTGDVTGSITVTGASSSVSSVTVSGNIVIAKPSPVNDATRGSAGGGGQLPAGSKPEKVPSATEATSTSTEVPETTTTSTEAPQQATEKPTNPTEGKADSSNSHVASHVSLFIGTIALLSVV